MEHDEQLDKLEQEGDQMQARSEDLDAQIDSTRKDWDAKVEDAGVPGAQREEDLARAFGDEPGEPEQAPGPLRGDEDVTQDDQGGGPKVGGVGSSDL